MDRGKKYAAIKKGEAGERVTSKDQVTARVAIFELLGDVGEGPFEFFHWQLS